MCVNCHGEIETFLSRGDSYLAAHLTASLTLSFERNACPPKWLAFFDNVMSQSEVTTSIAPSRVFNNLVNTSLQS